MREKARAEEEAREKEKRLRLIRPSVLRGESGEKPKGARGAQSLAMSASGVHLVRRFAF